jgi:Ca-activated chloride channel family protein
LYQALKVALDILKQHHDDKTLWNYLPAIVAMTDGLSQTGHYSLFEHALKTYPFASDVPIHAIAFGSADKQQLRALTQQSIGRLFDSQGDLGKTLREAKGYN